MNECFRNVNVDIDIDPDLKYGDYRDWFIIDSNKPKIHETEIKFFINNKFIYKDMMPINTKQIKYNMEAGVNCQMMIKSFKWIIVEMDWKKETIFDNPTIVTTYDMFKIDGVINFKLGDD